jgi:hypothetical protein
VPDNSLAEGNDNNFSRRSTSNGFAKGAPAMRTGNA